MRVCTLRVAILILMLASRGSASTGPNSGRFLQSDPRAVVKDETTCSDALLSALATKIEGENLDESLRVLQGYATLCSINAEYHALRSRALEDGSNWPDAAKEMNTAIKLDPQRPNFFFRLAQILFKNGDLGGARVLLERANRDFPEELWTYLFLATVHRDLGSVNESDKMLSRAVTKWPLNPEVHILLGNMLAETNQDPSALAEFKKALELNPKLPQAYLFYGIELEKLDQIEDAVRALTECVRLAPQIPNAHYYLGTSLLKKNEAAKAIEHLQMAIDIDPKYALAYFQLGKSYSKLGDRRRADEYMQKYGVLSAQQKSDDAERSKHFRDGLTGH
jgi:tetratricopeptide (TPR) repeat protein